MRENYKRRLSFRGAFLNTIRLPYTRGGKIIRN